MRMSAMVSQHKCETQLRMQLRQDVADHVIALAGVARSLAKTLNVRLHDTVALHILPEVTGVSFLY